MSPDLLLAIIIGVAFGIVIGSAIVATLFWMVEGRHGR